MKYLLVGTNDHTIAEHAKKLDKNAFLIDKNNFDKIIQNIDDVYVAYTSQADLEKISTNQNQLYTLLLKANNIIYSPPESWLSVIIYDFTHPKVFTEFLLSQFNNVQYPENFKYQYPNYLQLVDFPKNNEPNLVVAGASDSHGVGVNIHEKYSYIVSKHLKLNLVSLTQIGTSIEWSADQILRSNISKHDIVVWGLTSEFRRPRLKNGKYINETNVDILTSETSIYKSITSIHQVINFCHKIECKLLLLPLLSSEHIRILLSNVPEYINVPYQTKPLDIGTDGEHPGPKQHKVWADIILNELKKYEILTS